MSSAPPPPPDERISASKSLEYWNAIPPTIDGMLGGIPQISRTDLRGSATFLAKLRREHPAPPPPVRGVDCGAGIGRVTAGLLSSVCDVVDVVEPIERFAREVKGAEMGGGGRVGDVYVMGLQDWVPEARYGLVWIQWCLGHLTDGQVVDFLGRCKGAVTAGGWIVVKENVSTDVDGGDIFDETDSSVTRADGKFLRLFEEAGLRLGKTEVQRGFPKELFPVRFYALRA